MLGRPEEASALGVVGVGVGAVGGAHNRWFRVDRLTREVEEKEEGHRRSALALVPCRLALNDDSEVPVPSRR